VAKSPFRVIPSDVPPPVAPRPPKRKDRPPSGFSDVPGDGYSMSLDFMALPPETSLTDSDVPPPPPPEEEGNIFTRDQIVDVVHKFVAAEKEFIAGIDFLTVVFMDGLTKESQKGNTAFISPLEAEEIFTGVKDICDQHRAHSKLIFNLCTENGVDLEKIADVYSFKINKLFVGAVYKAAEYYDSAVFLSERLRRLNKGYSAFLTEAERRIPPPYNQMKFEQFLQIPLDRVKDLISFLSDLRPDDCDGWGVTMKESLVMDEASQEAEVFLESLTNGYEKGEGHKKVHIVDLLVDNLDKFVDVQAHDRRYIGIWNTTVCRRPQGLFGSIKEDPMTLFFFNNTLVFTKCNLPEIPPSFHTSLPGLTYDGTGPKPYTAVMAIEYAKLNIIDNPVDMGTEKQPLTIPRDNNVGKSKHRRDGFFLKFSDEFRFVRFANEQETNEVLFRSGNPRAATTVFGTPLLELLGRERKLPIFGNIPKVFEVLGARIRSEIDSEGIFRISPTLPEKKEVRELINSGECVNRPESLNDHDVYAVSVSLKELIFELPQHLCNDKMFERVLQIAREPKTNQEKAQEIFAEIKKEPVENKSVLLFLFKLMEEVVAHSQSNKMDWNAISIVVTPRFVVCPDDRDDLQPYLKSVTEVFTYLLEAKTIWGNLDAWV